MIFIQKVNTWFESKLDLANGSFSLGWGLIMFGSGKVQVTQILFGFGLIELGFGSG